MFHKEERWEPNGSKLHDRRITGAHHATLQRRDSLGVASHGSTFVLVDEAQSPTPLLDL